MKTREMRERDLNYKEFYSTFPTFKLKKIYIICMRRVSIIILLFYSVCTNVQPARV